jgi:hypothetical protein
MQEEKLMSNVIGVFEDSSQARQAIDRMKKDHIEGMRIDMLARDSDRNTTKASAAGLRRALTGMGVPDEEATTYESQVAQGKVLVAVQAQNDSEADRAANLMAVVGAVDVEGAGETGNTEAAPEYEGARTDETSGTDRRESSPSRAGRIRVFGARK